VVCTCIHLISKFSLNPIHEDIPGPGEISNDTARCIRPLLHGILLKKTLKSETAAVRYKRDRELDAFFIMCVVTWSPNFGFMLRYYVEYQHIHELSQLLINGGVLVD